MISRHRLANVACILLVVIGLPAAIGSSANSVLRVEAIEILDDSGNVAITMHAKDGAGKIVLTSSGEQNFTLRMAPDGLMVSNEATSRHLIISDNAMRLWRGDGGMLVVGDDGVLLLTDDNGNERVSIGIDNANSIFRMLDAAGQGRVTVAAGTDGSVAMDLNAGKSRVTIAASEDGSEIAIMDNGVWRWRANDNPQGESGGSDNAETAR